MPQFLTTRIGVLSTILALGLPSLATARSMTLDDIANISSVRGVFVAPDGSSTAYILSVPRNPFKEDNGEARTRLMIKRAGEPGRRYVGGDYAVSAVSWSPDSSAVYFLGKLPDDEANRLYSMRVDGGEATVVCDLKTQSISGYDVAPDGESLVLHSTPGQTEAQKQAEEAGFDARVVEESSKLAELRMISVSDDTNCAGEPVSLEGHVANAQFSPDGGRVLVKIAPTSLIDDGYMQTRMRVVDLEGAVRTRIDNLGKLGAAKWSPDGNRIAFIGVNDFNDPGEGRLKVADAASGDIRTLLFGLEGHVQHFVWQGNGSLIASVHLGTESELWRVDLKTGNHKVLVGQGDLIVRDLSASSDGKTIHVIADSPTHPQELYRLSGNRLVRETNSNSWLTEVDLGRQETLNYTAKDGLALQGLVVYPLNYDKARQYPLLIFVHGGPEAHRSDGWLTNYGSPIQHAAAEGYVSFVPNYRGSTGRGVEFSKLDQHAYATPEFDDIVDGKDALVKMGVVDPAKVGITGGSYGGYATAWSATALSEHYAAGVMFVGISNQISKFGTSDIPQEMHAVHSRAWPWEDWQFMLERSPIFHATNSKTPLLIMHGDSDPRVHPSESLQMYRYLKLAGQAPVRLVWYPGEKHGNRKAAAQYDYSLRFMRWMNHYLKGPGGEPPPYEVDYEPLLNQE